MNRLFIVAPSQLVVDYYLRTIERSRKDVTAIVNRFDCNRLRGLWCMPVTVLNADRCDEYLIDFLKAVSKAANLKLEYKNV